jgi:hypothetical protein
MQQEFQWKSGAPEDDLKAVLVDFLQGKEMPNNQLQPPGSW